MKMTSLWLVGVLGLVTVSLSCGGGSVSCDGTQPCGGDPTGTWSFVSDCEAPSMGFSNTCPTATVSASGVSISGMISFNADKSYSVSQAFKANVSVSLPASCLTQGGVTVSCAQLTTVLQGEIANGTAPYKTISCSGSGGCTCLATVDDINDDSGTWSSAGTVITLGSAAGSSDGGSYCVKGNEIHLLTLSTSVNMGAMGTARIQSDVVGRKQ
ncbi:MAG: hypothetical protein JWM82_842 [Myxococcales bacterium]|nr:hypothetical protein [Myxococcales bacterium]